MGLGLAYRLARNCEMIISFAAKLTDEQGNAIELAAKDWRVWAASRVFTGMGNGLVQTQCVIYIAEVAPINIRGTLLASYAFAYQIGGLCGAIGLQVLQTVSHPPWGASDRSRTTSWTTSGFFCPNGSSLASSSSAGSSFPRPRVSVIWRRQSEFMLTLGFFCRKDDVDGTKKALTKLYGQKFDVDRECSLSLLWRLTKLTSRPSDVDVARGGASTQRRSTAQQLCGNLQWVQSGWSTLHG